MSLAAGIVVASAFGALLRFAVSLNSYSGENKPPMFGDYEAQRHWMEITYNLPIEEWYVNNTRNDLQYWGLDYPPLTAYHSWVAGAVADMVNSTWVELFTSRGIESQDHKLFMRYSVLAVDLLVYFPATFLYAAKQQAQSTGVTYREKVGTVAALLTYPGLILIDYGHFQYNCVSLGLTLLALALLCADHDLLGSAAFVLALNYKQMELYHALPFFSYLLGLSFYGKQNWIVKLLKLGVVVVATFTACWWPFLQSKDLVLQVLHRLFPFSRGLYEDKVANLWCSISVVVKLKKIFTLNQILKLCLGTTVVMLIPSSLSMVFRPTKNKLKIGLINSSLVFFLFSFHVHEKSILLAALPVCAFLPHRPFPCMWFLLISTFSMLPLLIKDGLVLPATASCLLFYIIVSIIFEAPHRSTMMTAGGKTFTVTPSGQFLPRDLLLNSIFFLSMLGCAGLTVASLCMTAPSHLPDLFPLLVSIYACAHFLLFLVYFHYLQVTWLDIPLVQPQAQSRGKGTPKHSSSKHKVKAKQH